MQYHEENQDDIIECSPSEFMAAIENCRSQKRWIDLPVLALGVEDMESASILVDTAMASGDYDIVSACLKNLADIPSISVSTSSLHAFLSLRKLGDEVLPPADLVAGIAGGSVAMNVIDRYRTMVEQLLANRS